MSTYDLKADKLDLINWIAQLQDASLIEKLKSFRAKENRADYDVPQWQKEIVQERIAKTKKEDYLSWEDVEKQLKF
ncbi:MAG: hypothetical protein ACPGVC_10455 [Salibacteraceae bacterium]